MSCGCSKSHLKSEKFHLITDAFGPFPDETILTGVDRMLYIFGLPTGMPSLSQIGSSFRRHVGLPGIEEIVRKLPAKSIDKIGKFVQDAFGDKSFDKCCNAQSKDSCSSIVTAQHCESGEECNQKQHHKICSNCGRRKVSNTNCIIPDLLNKYATPSSPAPSGRQAKKSALTRSFSLCSLACRSIKEKFSNFQKNISPQWHWTRKYSECEHEIYELFPNDTKNLHGKHSKSNNSPKMILIVSPDGKVYPFEMVTTHF